MALSAARLCRNVAHLPLRSCRLYSTVPNLRNDDNASPAKVDVEKLLSTPTWSVASLLPTPNDEPSDVGITPKQLHHLLRLSALPPPKDAEEEERMLSTLSSQLHFVKDVQKANTENTEPLRSVRDETTLGRKEAELGLSALKDAMAKEQTRGKYHRRIRRSRDIAQSQESDWDPLRAAARKTGRYLVVEGGGPRSEN